MVRMRKRRGLDSLFWLFLCGYILEGDIEDSECDWDVMVIVSGICNGGK